jgi:hypothetical protein
MGDLLARHGAGRGGNRPVNAVPLLGIAIVVALLILAVAGIWLNRKSERRLAQGPAANPDQRLPASPADDQVSAYLDRLGAGLALPAADVAEVRAEVADHLADSIAALQAGGLGRDAAIAEALTRLGPADELGRQLRRAHQSTRRLLAGAGGGVLAAGGGFIFGYMVGGVLIFAAALVLAGIASALATAGIRLPDLSFGDTSGQTSSAILRGLALAVAAATAMRWAARTSAATSRRTPTTLAWAWAALGGVAFGVLGVFGIRGYQNWPVVGAELCIPVAAIAGALVRIDRPLPHIKGPILAAAVIVAIAAPVALFAGVSTTGGSPTGAPAAVGQVYFPQLDSAAPPAPERWLPSGTFADLGTSGPQDGTAIYAHLSSDNPAMPVSAIMANWRDLKLEAWHGLPFENYPGPIGIDPAYASPFEVQPAVVVDATVQAVFHFERIRDVQSWWVVLTATGPDGNRYRLSDWSGSSVFDGSAWDWLTARQ